ncbi:MAG: ABC transporter permease [Gemmataceae bacterium]|nr:ABC transporter permease [Gemmataceae bacterium]
MRKILVVATREYLAAVRTKTFVLGLLLMPLMMGGSAILQYLVRDAVDLRDKHYAVVDRTPGGQIADLIKEHADKYNQKITTGTQLKPRFVVKAIKLQGATDAEKKQQRYHLSEQVRRGELAGFFEVEPGKDCFLTLRYQTNRPTDTHFSQTVEKQVADAVRESLRKETNLSEQHLKVIVQPVELKLERLTTKDEQGVIREAYEHSRWTAIGAPIVLMMLMFTVVLMGTMPLMQGVVEEKMQRIAEVLLGSVRPFELMMGKLLGMTAVSMTITAVYLGGAYWVGLQFDVVDQVSTELLAWFLFYEALAALMFGSLFIAVGAACTDMKETQNLLWPVMLLVVLPVFLLGSVLREPNSPIVVGLSFFPFATPMMMVTRMAVPPGIPWWQPVLGGVPVLLTTVLCVWAAGRIFRVGILMQGKGARIGEMVRWILRG